MGSKEFSKSYRDKLNEYVTNRDPAKREKLKTLKDKIRKAKDESEKDLHHTEAVKLIKEHGDKNRDREIEKLIKNCSKVIQATHVQKYTHPDITFDASIVAYDGGFSKAEKFVSTNTILESGKIPYRFLDYVSSSAAYINIGSLLRIIFDGNSLFELATNNDKDLVKAISNDDTKAKAWTAEISKIEHGRESTKTDSRAKQLYFPLPNQEYHLLSPLFPTSLGHAIYSNLWESLRSESSEEARKAKSEGKPYSQGYADYPELAGQAFGGTQPQNISQLNNERHGEAWLLASCPPTWRTNGVQPPLNIETVFGRWFGGRRRVHDQTRALANFLTATDYNNVNIRHSREAMVDRVVDELIQFAAELHELDPGWSATPECKLNTAEALWLDPGRSQGDEAFAAQRLSEDWQEQVADRFGGWFNKELRYFSKKRGELALGDVEHEVWQKVAKHALGMLRAELSHDY